MSEVGVTIPEVGVTIPEESFTKSTSEDSTIPSEGLTMPEESLNEDVYKTEYLIWKIPAVRPQILEIDKKQSYKVHERDHIVKLMYHLCDHVIVHWVPKWVSPVILSVPGTLMHIFLMIMLLCVERERWMYGFYFATKVITFVFDVIDGQHARNTNTQSTARHFWDHSLDILCAVLNSVIVVHLAPPNRFKVVPPAFLLFVSMTVFYTNFVNYFSTGKMYILYNVHACNYVYGVFLPLTVAFLGLPVLDTIEFQMAFTTLNVCIQISSIVSISFFLYHIITNNSQWRWILALAFPGPILNIIIYILWEYLVGPNIVMRLLAATVAGSYIQRVHANQLHNAPIHPVTPEFFVYLFVCIGFGFPSAFQKYVLWIIFGVIGIIWWTFVVVSIRKMVADFPEVGFPIFVITRERQTITINTSPKLSFKSIEMKRDEAKGERNE